MEKKLALEALAIVLMRIRDGKAEGINPDGTLVKLTKELMKIAHVNQIELETQMYTLNKTQSSKNNLDNINTLEYNNNSDKEHSNKETMNRRTKYDVFRR